MSKEILKKAIADEIEGKGNELSKLLEKYRVDLTEEIQPPEIALEAKDKEIQDAKQQVEQIRQAAAQNYHLINHNVSTANDRANSADRERLKMQEDLRIQQEAGAKEVENLKSQIHLADAKFQALHDFVAAS